MGGGTVGEVWWFSMVEIGSRRRTREVDMLEDRFTVSPTAAVSPTSGDCSTAAAVAIWPVIVCMDGAIWPCWENPAGGVGDEEAICSWITQRE